MLDLISTYPTAFAMLAGIVLTFAAHVTKKTGVSSKAAVLIMAFIGGALYTTFQTWVPYELQDSIASFVGKMFATSWAFYEFVWKPINKPLPPEGGEGTNA